MKDEKPQEHLGDGVYAEFDGFGILLKANDHRFPTDKIYLEPEVLTALNRFAERMAERRGRELKDIGDGRR